VHPKRWDVPAPSTPNVSTLAACRGWKPWQLAFYNRIHGLITSICGYTKALADAEQAAAGRGSYMAGASLRLLITWLSDCQSAVRAYLTVHTSLKLVHDILTGRHVMWDSPRRTRPC